MRLLIGALIAGESYALFFESWQLYLSLIIPFLGFGIIYAGSVIYKLYYLEARRIKRSELRVWGSLCLVVFILGFCRTAYLERAKVAQQLPASLDGTIWLIQGYIESLPKLSARSAQLNLIVESAKPLSKKRADLDATQIPKRLYLSMPVVKQPVNPGQVWQFQVKLNTPRGLKNPHTFDFERWLLMQDIGAVGQVQKGSERFVGYSDWHFIVMVERIRSWIRARVHQSLGEGAIYRGVMSALVMGDQHSISEEDWKIFNATGIGHLISISGLHVTMLAGLGAWLANQLWRNGRLPILIPAQKIAALVGFLTAFIYTWLAGFQIPAQRTMLMVGVVGLGLWLGRVLKPFDIWWWALGMVLFLNPWAIYTPGFWLSFGAVAAILYAMPPDRDGEVADVDLLFIAKLKESLGAACRVQAVVTIALIPMTLWWFSQISLVSPLANAIAIPIISFIVTPLAMLGVVLPWWLGDTCLWLSHQAFWVVAWFLKPMAEWQWAVIHGAKPWGWMLVIALVGVVLSIRPGPLRHAWKSRLFGTCICFSLLIPRQWLFGNGIAHGEFEMFVWDIGQGSAVLIKTQEHHLLYDTGPTSRGNFDPGRRVIMPYLRAEDIRSLDRLVISHQDADHIGGLVSIIQEYPVQSAIGSIPGKHLLQREFIKNQVPLKPCKAGSQWQWDGVDFIIWHPPAKTTFEEHFFQGKPNEMSCVLEVRNRFHSVWLTGDIESGAEREVVNRLMAQVQHTQMISTRNRIVMAPHHGSKTSSTALFLNQLKPHDAFSQTGYRNRYGHPHPVVVRRYQAMGIDLKDTSQTGAQTWTSKKDVFTRIFQRNVLLEQFK